ncbi:MAG: hypothetical protein HY007_02230 [Candidatus Sungbacteria bacterium]|nr:hypothetical protein [Candidatus Sungbacteria bacterium]
MTYYHTSLAEGRWQTFSFFEQMANIGSEVHRALMWQEKNKGHFDLAIDRALELFDFTLEDPRWRGPKLKELARARELLCYAAFGENPYHTDLADLDKYFFTFAFAARLKR